jgi:hypothetical protein
MGVTEVKLGRRGGLARLRSAAAAAPGVEAVWNDLAVALRDAGDDAAAHAAWVESIRLRDPEKGPPAPLARLIFSSDDAVHEFKIVDYRYRSEIRHGSGRPPHPEIAARLDQGRERYAALLRGMGEIQSDFAEVPMGGTYEEEGPFWFNVWFPALDGMALTQMLRAGNPARFIEIGSGTSTKFARRAVRTYGLRTRLVSIDPEPRASIDRLCDEVVRQPLERCDVAMFQSLEAGDILFLDSSHRAFQGSDVTVFFTEILPRLKPGVIVHVHDIYLPDDYIRGHIGRLWNEQYLLAVLLLFGGDSFEVLFPAWYVGQDPQLRALGRSLLCKGPLADVDLYGASFWMRKT